MKNCDFFIGINNGEYCVYVTIIMLFPVVHLRNINQFKIFTYWKVPKVAYHLLVLIVITNIISILII